MMSLWCIPALVSQLDILHGRWTVRSSQSMGVGATRLDPCSDEFLRDSSIDIIGHVRPSELIDDWHSSHTKPQCLGVDFSSHSRTYIPPPSVCAPCNLTGTNWMQKAECSPCWVYRVWQILCVHFVQSHFWWSLYFPFSPIWLQVLRSILLYYNVTCRCTQSKLQYICTESF